MKKTFLLVLTVLFIAGTAWAQGPSLPSPLPDISAGKAFELGRINLSVVPPLSTQAKNSAGIFLADADSFADPRFHDPEMDGNFFFLGGDVNIGDTDYRADLGFAKNFGKVYIGLYFGGGFVYAGGIREKADNYLDYTHDDTDVRFRASVWDTKLAFLLGIGSMGFRLDFGMEGDVGSPNTRVYAERGSDTYLVRERNFGPTFALTWGGQFGDVAPWVRVGFRIPTAEIGEFTDHGYKYETKYTSEGALEISGGLEYALNENAVIGGELWFDNRFRAKYTKTETGEVDVTNKGPGGLGFGLLFYYTHTLDLGPVGIGFGPNMKFGIATNTAKYDFSPGTSYERHGDLYTSLDIGLDVGAKWNVSERVNFFAGISMRFFDWTTWTQTGTDTYDPDPDAHVKASQSAWIFSGIELYDLNIGMTFDINENIAIGLGLNSFIKGLFGGGSSSGPSFDFTISAKFGGSGGN